MGEERGHAVATWVPIGLAGIAALMLAASPVPRQCGERTEAPSAIEGDSVDRTPDETKGLQVATPSGGKDSSEKPKTTSREVPSSDKEKIRSEVNGALKTNLPAGSFRIARIAYDFVPGKDDGGQRVDVSVISDAGKDDGKEAPGKVAAALAKMAEALAGDGFRVRMLSVTVSGVPSEDYGDSPASVSAHDADWVVGASVDIPAEDGKSLGDVNSSVAVRHGKKMDFDLQAAGFSDKLPEE